jgi:hypothetical protein
MRVDKSGYRLSVLVLAFGDFRRARLGRVDFRFWETMSADIELNFGGYDLCRPEVSRKKLRPSNSSFCSKQNYQLEIGPSWIVANIPSGVASIPFSLSYVRGRAQMRT